MTLFEAYTEEGLYVDSWGYAWRLMDDEWTAEFGDYAEIEQRLPLTFVTDIK